MLGYSLDSDWLTQIIATQNKMKCGLRYSLRIFLIEKHIGVQAGFPVHFFRKSYEVKVKIIANLLDLTPSKLYARKLT